MKKKYITLRDRTWKGKEWWTSFYGVKNIRTLTDEEASTLEDIQEVIPLKPLEENVVGDDNSRMFCLKCGSKRGFFVHKVRRGKMSDWYSIFKCGDCGCREKRK